MTHTSHALKDKTLVFLHIQKCAGNSFIEILDGFFRRRDMLKAHLLHRGAPEITRPIDTYRSIIGHNTWDDIAAIAPHNPVFMTVLREPVARVTSLYHFWRSHRWEHIEKYNLKGPRLAKTLPLEEFIESPEFEARLNVRNGQSRQFVNGLRGPTGLSNEELYAIASNRLQQCAFIGFTEEFEKSVQLLCHTFGWQEPEVLPRENISKENEQLDPRYEPIEKVMLTDTARRRLEELNSVDIRLYDYGNRIFTERYKEMRAESSEQNQLRRPLLSYRLRQKWRSLTNFPRERLVEKSD